MKRHQADNGYRVTYRRSCDHLVGVMTEDIQMARRTNPAAYRRIVADRAASAAASKCGQCDSKGEQS